MPASPAAASDGVVNVSGHLVKIARPSVPLYEDFSLDGHLLCLHESGIYISTGKWGGPVRLHVESWDAAPPLDTAGWETIVERSFTGTPERLYTESGSNDVVEFPALEHLQIDASFRIRAYAAGRDTSYDQIDESVSESFLLQFWQQSPSATENLAIGDEMARWWVSENS